MSCSLCVPPVPSEALKSENRWLINIIAGGVTVAVVLSVLVFFITFMTTKRLLEPSSEPSDDSLLVKCFKCHGYFSILDVHLQS